MEEETSLNEDQTPQAQQQEVSDDPLLEFHEIANIFPLMSEAELAMLADDIRANGLREPIWTYQDKIIDGRNRYLACQRAGVEPRFTEWGGSGSLVAFVASLNLHRRHLSIDQRAAVAARIKPLFEAEARDRQEASRARSGEQVGQARANWPGPGETGRARDRAAAALNVSPRSVERASVVLRSGITELVHAVEAGQIAVSTAAEIATLPADEQREVFAGGKRTMQEAAKESRTRKAAGRHNKNEAPPAKAVAPSDESITTPKPSLEVVPQEVVIVRQFVELLESMGTPEKVTPEAVTRFRENPSMAAEIKDIYQRLGLAIKTLWKALERAGFQP